MKYDHNKIKTFIREKFMKWLVFFLFLTFNSFANEVVPNGTDVLRSSEYLGISNNQKIYKESSKSLGKPVLIAMNAKRVNTPDQVDCTVCFEAYEKGSYNVPTLECGHTMCRDCIDSWKAANNGRLTCPYCRKLDPKVYTPAKFCGSVKKNK